MSKPVKTSTVIVEEGQYVPLPNTSKYVLGGPGTIEVTRYVDGKVDGKITRGSSVPVELAIAKKWERLVWGA
jgi:hypothetical protein